MYSNFIDGAYYSYTFGNKTIIGLNSLYWNSKHTIPEKKKG
jgi:hypothetical protein